MDGKKAGEYTKEIKIVSAHSRHPISVSKAMKKYMHEKFKALTFVA